MEELMEVVLDLPYVKDLPNLLDGGVDAIVNFIGDAADEAVQSLIPAYATAVAICDAAPPQIPCGQERKRLRNLLLKELFEATGVLALIRQLLRAWRRVPQEVRRLVRSALAIPANTLDMLTDPSLESLKNTALAYVDMGRSIVKGYADLATRGLDMINRGGRIARKLASKAANEVVDVIRSVRSVAPRTFRVAAELAKMSGAGVVELVKEVVNHVGDIPSDAIQVIKGAWNIIESAPGALESVASDAIEALENVARDVVDAVADTAQGAVCKASFGLLC